MSNDAAVEQMIQDAGKIAPRITPPMIDALVASLTFSTAIIGSTTTITAAFLPNGFEVGIGKSACASPENFDAVIGEKIATDNARAAAREKLGELEGYVLRKQLDLAALPWQERVKLELKELGVKISALSEFLASPNIEKISEEANKDLQEQFNAMVDYGQILAARVSKF